MISESILLKKVFWPLDKLKILGSLIFTNSENLETIYSMTISRKEKKLEILYTSNTFENVSDITYLIKLSFNKVGNECTPDLENSSPNIKNIQDVEDVLNLVNNTIAKMNVSPALFSTGVVQSIDIKKL
jgi:hypothetical protein